MGEQASPVYQITYNRQMHDSNIHLWHDLGIDVINLADIKSISGFSEALDFFLTYIGKEYKAKWSGMIKNSSAAMFNSENEEVDALIREMRQVRESYPGWIVLPASRMQDFSDTKQCMPFWKPLYEKCANNITKQITFLFEMNWRIETALGFFDVEWYLEALEDLPFEYMGDLDNSTYQRLLGLKISLLNTYRLKGRDEDYKQLLKNIEARISQLRYEQKGLLIYTKCLSTISILDYTNVQQIIDDWTLHTLDYQGHLWKAGMLIEIGQIRKAQVMLLDLLKIVRRNILASKYSALLSSARSAIELFLWRMDWRKYSFDKTNPDFDFFSIIRACRDMIVEEDSLPSGHQMTHGFNLLSTGQCWSLREGGFQGDFYGTLRYFRLYEKLGLPFGMPGPSLDVKTETFMIERLLRYFPKYALQWIIRYCKAEAVEALNRKTLLHISREDACMYFDQWSTSCKAGLVQDVGRILQTRVLTCLLPVLVRLSVLLTQDRIEGLFDLLCVVYRQYPKEYNREQVQTLYNNLSGPSLKHCQLKALEQPILQSDVKRDDFKMPELWPNEIEYPVEAGKIAMMSLSSNKIQEQQAAYNRPLVLKRTKIDDSTSGLLDSSVKKWRATSSLSNDKLLSLFVFPEEEKEMISIATYELNSFLGTEFINNNSSTFIDEISNKLFRLQIGYSRFTNKQHLSFLEKITKILTMNEDAFKKDDSDNFLGGFRSHVKNIFSYLNYYSGVEGLPSKDNDGWQSFKSVIERYREYRYPVLTIMTHLSYLGIWDKTEVKGYVEKVLFSDSRTLVNDACNALVFMAKKQGSRVDQAIIKSMISKMSYVFDEDTCEHLKAIKKILLNKGMSEETATMLKEWVSKLPDRIENCSVSEEIKDDIRYYANQISGIISKVWSDWSRLSDWQAYMKKESIKNDVRNGFEFGVRLVIYSQTEKDCNQRSNANAFAANISFKPSEQEEEEL